MWPRFFCRIPSTSEPNKAASGACQAGATGKTTSTEETARQGDDASQKAEFKGRRWMPPSPQLPLEIREQYCIPEDYRLAAWPRTPYPPDVERQLSRILSRFSLTPWMLNRIAKRLSELPKPRVDSTYHTGKRAAVMAPLCDIDGIPSVLLTLRSGKVRTHKGHVSFPGGHLDLNDECMEGCAQRECMEELGLRVVAPTDRRLWEAEWRKRPYYPESNVLGRLPNCVAITGTLVTPIVGYLGPIEMKQIENLVNRDEVEEVFAMSIQELMTPSNVMQEDLRMVSAPPVFNICVSRHHAFSPFIVWLVVPLCRPLLMEI